MAAARELFAERGVSGVTTQQIADRADVAIGTLYRYAATKAELLIMVQNEKFAAAIDDGLAAAKAAAGRGALEAVVALVRPVVACVREQVENGRMYLLELVFGDPAEARVLARQATARLGPAAGAQTAAGQAGRPSAGPAFRAAYGTGGLTVSGYQLPATAARQARQIRFTVPSARPCS